MHKVLLVDDELITLNGMANIVKWDQYQTKLIGKSQNGLEAWNLVEMNKPDIIICDIKMPGLDGLQLLEKVKGAHPNIVFIILSGYSEFDFAKRAMEQGVKHYLLKPCNEEQIHKVLISAVKDIEENKKNEIETIMYKTEFKNALPKIKQQFLKELIMNKSFSLNEKQYYEKMFSLQLDLAKGRLLLFFIHEEDSFGSIHLVEKIVDKEFRDTHRENFSYVLNSRLAFLVPTMKSSDLIIHLKKIQRILTNESDINVTISYTNTEKLIKMSQCYKIAECSLGQRFYNGEGSLIHAESVHFTDKEEDIDLFITKIIGSLKSGNECSAYEDIARFFTEISEAQYSIDIAKAYSFKLYTSILNESNLGLDGFGVIEKMNSLEEIKCLILKVVEKVLKSQGNQSLSKQSKIVKEIKFYVNQYIDKEMLSLSWLANEILYMNADYLGKVFKKETGEKFSQYLLRIRMEKAQQLILETEEMKMVDIAKEIGFDHYPQYFSHVFKKYTDYTPTEYKKIHGYKS
ncbi:response regulator [Halalkalibacter sp. APA_J-10(15)]|uniref:response regulator transcription factor n=1 Tax=Halalkalibacter sp. APA_J-10(15) TaxID=2933805 RepID=UPI001FF41A18|nr:response regulator [Halalkalibacter sp. APA_J-10(15)]MCK0472803.1 response regulator [Halalkalibacter sp. APA_J-10(15)]